MPLPLYLIPNVRLSQARNGPQRDADRCDWRYEDKQGVRFEAVDNQYPCPIQATFTYSSLGITESESSHAMGMF